ncbi:phosphate/phosphite/phosphonate ABC transporter substrate-binding protein [Sediminibacillus albus]|uniref:Phosphonate transport system substrate-binding protein n=1 Tax=Sediminibacillus albus TaxID=407036 RepID=A0A1G8WGA7_9BACI|nr:phosphate/phosphite/phosphonate ABC transporter substrate-binding protein [Sediminibacillus albus]SDJ77344.1 phosphonate transport system substrate-binding protein [Sediminibacillus albus]
MKKWIPFAFILSLVLIITACGSNQENQTDQQSEDGDKDETFTIGVIPAQTEGEMEQAMDKLQSIIDEQMDKKVTVDVYPDYNGVVEAMNYDKIDMAYFGPLTYVVAHEKSGAKAIITQLIDGEPYYHSYIITHKDNPWESLDGLLENPAEVDFAFGDPNSTSGALIPEIELQDQGVYQSEDDHSFQSVRFTGSHDATALAVQNQQVDAGAIDSAIFNQLVESGKVDGEQVKTIWKSEELFQYPWAVHQDTDQETINILQETFQSIEDEEILNAFGATGFTTAENEDYESIRKAAAKQGIIEE